MMRKQDSTHILHATESSITGVNYITRTTAIANGSRFRRCSLFGG